MSKLSAEAWVDVRREYEGSPVPVGAIARRWPISRQAIQKRARREGWSRIDPNRVDSALATKLRSAATGSGESDLGPKAGRAELIQRHRQQWAELEEVRAEAMRAFADATYRPQDAPEFWTTLERHKHARALFRLFSLGAHALMLAQEGERRAWGFDYKDLQRETAVECDPRAEELVEEIMAMLDGLAGGDAETPCA